MLIWKPLAWLFLACALTAAPADASPFKARHPKTVIGGGGGGSSPDVLPGAGPITTFNSITPTNYGNPADYGYNIRGFARWDDIPLVEVGVSGTNGTRHIGLVAAHVATGTEVAAGLASNICSVDVRTDMGSWYTITGPSVNPDAGGYTDWNFTVNSQNYSDGVHKVDARIKPCTGPDIIMDGPLEDASHFATARAQGITVSDGTQLAAGNIMTVTGVVQNTNGQFGTSSIIAGYSVGAFSIGPNSFVDGTSTVNATSCVAQTGSNCTGAGGTGTYHLTGASQLAVGAAFTASLSGTAMTVSAVSTGMMTPDGFLFGSGVTAGMNIVGSATSNAGACIASTGSACTGSGGTGTYGLSASQTLGSRAFTVSVPAEIGLARSFYFVTDFHNTLGRGTHVTYVAAGGNDANSGTSYTSPKATIASAEGVIYTNGGSSAPYGGTICLMNGMNILTETGSGNYPTSTLGWTVIQGADQAPCVSPGDTGHPKMHFDISNRTYVGLRGWFKWMDFDQNGPNSFNGGLATQLVVQNVRVTGNVYDASLVGAGGIACLESTITFTYNGCTAQMARNLNITYASNHTFHASEFVIGNTSTGSGPIFAWTTGTSTLGSNVITGVTVPGGYTIGQIFPLPPAGKTCDTSDIGCIGVDDVVTGFSCFPAGAGNGTSITAINEAAHTITTDKVATQSCVGHLMFPDVHGDLTDIIVNTYGADLIFADNLLDVVYPGWVQGFFIEADRISGIYSARNTWTNGAGTSESILFTAGGGHDRVIFQDNIWNSSGSYRVDQAAPSTDTTYVNDKCVNGGGFTGTGTNLRRKAAATQACYVSAP